MKQMLIFAGENIGKEGIGALVAHQLDGVCWDSIQIHGHCPTRSEGVTLFL
jgi:hypothetical protein